MPRAEEQQLIVDLRLRDQLSGALATVKANLATTEAQIGQIGAAASKAGTSLGGLGSSFTSIAKAGVVAFGAFQALNIAGDFFAGAIKGAQDEEVSIARLTAALDANVPAWDGNRDAIERVIAKREELGFSDDALRDSLGSLVAATHDVNQALDIQNTAMDLARFKGVSLEEATKALITIEAGRFRGLAQLGIVLKEGATQTEALAAVQAVAGGQAQAFGETTAGAMEAASVAVQDLQEDIGKGLAPVVKDLAVSIRTDLIPAVEGFGNTINVFLLPLQLAAQAEAAAKAELEKLAQAAKAAASQHEDLGQAQIELQKSSQIVIGSIADTKAELIAAAAAAHKVVDAFIILGTTVDPGVVAAFAAAQKGVGLLTGEMAILQAQTEGTIGALKLLPKSGAAGHEVPFSAPTKEDQPLKELTTLTTQHTAAVKDLGKAFTDAGRTADTLFDALHNRHLRAIKDAETLAEKNHDAALQAISDNLKAEQSRNAAPVTAAEKALADRQAAESRRNLVEALQAAQGAGDTRDIRNATEALANFDAAAVIGRLKDVAETLDAASQKAADTATSKADAELARAKTQAQKDRDAETIADRKRTDQFERELAALKERDKGAPRAKQDADIAALQKRFGITIDPVTGFHHIDDPLVTAIKNIKQPAIVQTFFLEIPAGAIVLNGRALNDALRLSLSPSQAPTVRTGAGGRA